MFRRYLAFFAVVIVVAALALAGTQRISAVGDQAQQQQPAFKSGILVVPIDVRVIDNKTGKPVTDLKQEDFTLLENDVAQPIRHFEKQVLTADPKAPPPGIARPPLRESAFGVTPQNNRIFLIVLGRGRLQEPSKAVDALIHFVRNQLLPQDQVAVFAYDRATDFTTDHEFIAKLIERFRTMHYEINMEVSLETSSGLAAVYGSKSIPKKLQVKIDALFDGSGAVANKELGRGETAATKRAEGDSRQAIDALQRQDVKLATDKMNEHAVANLGADASAPGMLWTSSDEIAASAFTDLGLDDFMAYNAQTLQDLGNCYAGIEYLRHLEGEKHLVFVTEKGMYLPRLDDDVELAKAANDARVSINTFQTGGVEGQRGGTPQSHFSETFAFKSLRTIAELTGGVSAVGEQGMTVVDRINQASLTDYVLGYYPSLARFDGTYRKITVKVNRPDTTVLYRHGYFARRDVGTFDRRSFITRDRIMAAGNYSREMKDIKIKMEAALQKNGPVHEVSLKATIDPSTLAWTVKNGIHSGSIDIAIVCSNEKGEVLGQNYQRANLEINEEVWAKVSKDGVPYNVRMEMNAGVRTVRLIVYDYKADLVGSVDKRVW